MITKEIVIVLYKVENGTIMETPKQIEINGLIFIFATLVG